MKVIKSGISDSFQDLGRFGYTHLGVGNGGFMDKVAGKIANWLVGNNENAAVLEMHFPAPVLHFKQSVTIALSGANFGAVVNGKNLPVNRRIRLPVDSTLHFTRHKWGQWGYLAVANGWALEMALQSCSTHLKAGFGGWQGRRLKAGDIVKAKVEVDEKAEVEAKAVVERWFPNTKKYYLQGPIKVMRGPEWDWLTKESQHRLEQEAFTISPQSDRMGYHLNGKALEKINHTELLSSAVLPGTVQLLPNGSLLILMADCQTTGGYPRILQVAEVSLPLLAQMEAAQPLTFELISVEEAIILLENFEKELLLLKSTILLM
jgi:antagonist of KipI